MTCNFLMCLLHFLVRGELFPHECIAFFVFVFPGMPKCAPRSIFEAFGRPLGSLGGSFGRTFELWGRLGTPSVPILVSWGALWRTHGSLGTTLAVIQRSSCHNFEGFDVQITNNYNYSKSSHLRLPSFLQVSLASVMCTSPMRL